MRGELDTDTDTHRRRRPPMSPRPPEPTRGSAHSLRTSQPTVAARQASGVHSPETIKHPTLQHFVLAAPGNSHTSLGLCSPCSQAPPGRSLSSPLLLPRQPPPQPTTHPSLACVPKTQPSWVTLGSTMTSTWPNSLGNFQSPSYLA